MFVMEALRFHKLRDQLLVQVLFIITLLVNMTARWIVSRHKEFSGAN